MVADRDRPRPLGAGAEIRTNTTVRAIGAARKPTCASSSTMACIDAATVVVAAGAGISELLLDSPRRLRATRQALALFELQQPDVFDPA